MSMADKFALFVSLGKGLSPRGQASRFLGGLSLDAYTGNNPEQQKTLDMHKMNIIVNPHY